MAKTELKRKSTGEVFKKTVHFPTDEPLTKTISPFAFHQGRTLVESIAKDYPTLLDVILEQVQNAIDANAGRIWITLNQKARNMTISDNGDGQSKEEFEEALISVCDSLKLNLTGKLGRYGKGNMAPLGKCERNLFISTSKNNPRGYLEWEFKTAEIIVKKVIDGIPFSKRNDLVFNLTPKRGETKVPWRTQIKIENYTRDRVISQVSVDSLKAAVLEKFGNTMRRLRVVVSVRIYDEKGQELCKDIKAEPFSGRRLEEVVINDKDAGDTVFRLFVAKKTLKGRKGKIVVGEIGNEFRISFTRFAKSSASKWLIKEAVEVLNSGFFEGEVLNQNVKFHSDRQRFEQNEALVGFCAAIEVWYKEYGINIYQEIKEERREKRYQELAINSLKSLENLLKNPKFAGLLDVVKHFKLGTVGVGHKKPEKEQLIGVSEGSSVAITSLTREPKEKNGEEKKSGKREEPKKDKPEHKPLTVEGPSGRRRTLVSSDSLGLNFLPEPLESEKPWELETLTGTLRFNTLHPLWALCEDNDRALIQYMEYIALQALVLFSLPEDWTSSGLLQLAYEELLSPYAYAIRLNEETPFKRTKKEGRGEKEYVK